MQSYKSKEKPQDSADLFSQRRVYTVSEITQEIKSILEGSFGTVWVEGEVSNVNLHLSGHCYFSLKDKGAVLPAAVKAQSLLP